MKDPFSSGSSGEGDLGMPLRKILGLICPLAGVTCLAVGFAMLLQWLALLGVLLALLAWLLTWKWPSGWLPFAALTLSVCLSAAGIFAGVSPVLMILSAALALAGWDLALFDLALTDSALSNPPSRLAHSHSKSLAFAIILGLLAALAGRLFRIQLPFGGLILLVLLALLSLDRLWRTLGG